MTVKSKTLLSFKKLLLAFCLLVFAVYPAFAREFESLENITHLVKSFINNELESNNIKNATISVRKLDSRLKLNKCTTLLKPNLNATSNMIGRLMVAVNCMEPKPWTVHVPVEVTVYKTVLAAARHLPKGHVINNNDLRPISIKLGQANNGFFIKQENLIGKQIKRPIAMGKVIKPRFVEAARMVQRGENVTIIAVTQSIQVSMKGIALADGAQGQMIQVRNLKTKQVVQGIVTKPGFVKVRM